MRYWGRPKAVTGSNNGVCGVCVDAKRSAA
jgi:hypothetical protein